MADKSFRVRLPEGLYLFQPYREARNALWDNKERDLVSPLFLVKNGRLIDPTRLAYRTDVDKFLATYVINKTFNVFIGSEMVGSLSQIILTPLDTCYTKEFYPELLGKGKYSGSPIDTGGTGVWLAPPSFGSSKPNQSFDVTPEDRINVMAALRKKVSPEAAAVLNKRLKERREVIVREGESKFDQIEAIDLDGNGKKDFIGIYTYLGVTNTQRVRILEVMFVVWDTGKAERILFENGMLPAFLWGGVIDVDQDGRQELIVQVLVPPETECNGACDDGKRIVIFRYSASRWVRVYQSDKIGCY